VLAMEGRDDGMDKAMDFRKGFTGPGERPVEIAEFQHAKTEYAKSSSRLLFNVCKGYIEGCI
jgi:hypothetical protein